MRGLETYLVVSGVVGDESEFTRGGTTLGYDAVVVVEDLVDEDEDLEGGIGDVTVQVVVVLLGFVVA